MVVVSEHLGQCFRSQLLLVVEGADKRTLMICDDDAVLGVELEDGFDQVLNQLTFSIFPYFVEDEGQQSHIPCPVVAVVDVQDPLVLAQGQEVFGRHERGIPFLGKGRGKNVLAGLVIFLEIAEVQEVNPFVDDRQSQDPGVRQLAAGLVI